MLLQGSLIPDLVEEQRLDADPAWMDDNWESPTFLGEFISTLVLPTDRIILDAGAGTGQLTRFLPVVERIHCFEISPERIAKGRVKTAHNLSVVWEGRDYLEVHPSELQADLVVGNPPFSLLTYFLDQSLQLLNPDYEHARVLFILPGNCFQTKGRNSYFKNLGCHIHHCYQITGRVAYLKNGVPQKGRQIEDAVFDIRPGQKPGGVSFIENPQ
jgi:predicted RNA methylase